MGKPTSDELNLAIAEAARLRETGEDENYVGKALLNFNYRMRFLEDVLHKCKIYLHSGEGAHEHAALIHAIERAEKAQRAVGEDEEAAQPW